MSRLSGDFLRLFKKPIFFPVKLNFDTHISESFRANPLHYHIWRMFYLILSYKEADLPLLSIFYSVIQQWYFISGMFTGSVHQTLLTPAFCDADTEAVKMSRTLPCPLEANSLVSKDRYAKNWLPHSVKNLRLRGKQVSHSIFYSYLVKIRILWQVFQKCFRRIFWEHWIDHLTHL